MDREEAVLSRPVVPQNTAAYRKADGWGRASPAGCASETPTIPAKTNPSSKVNTLFGSLTL